MVNEPWELACERAFRECESWGNKHISESVNVIIAELRAAKAEVARLNSVNAYLLEAAKYALRVIKFLEDAIAKAEG